MSVIQGVERKHMKAEPPTFRVGDFVRVEYLIREGDEERVQPFVGQVVRFGGSGIRKTFTVRRIVQNEGVERTFPLHSPRVLNVKVERGPNRPARRAKLYFLRNRTGKAAQM